MPGESTAPATATIANILHSYLKVFGNLRPVHEDPDAFSYTITLHRIRRALDEALRAPLDPKPRRCLRRARGHLRALERLLVQHQRIVHLSPEMLTTLTYLFGEVSDPIPLHYRHRRKPMARVAALKRSPGPRLIHRKEP